MAARSAGVKFLTGSPHVSCLEWNEECLTEVLCDRIRRFLGDEVEEANKSYTTISFSFPAWRLIEFEGDNTTNNNVPESPRPSSSRSMHAAIDANVDDEDHLEHSLAVIQDLKSSQIQALEETFLTETTSLTITTTSSTFDTSFATSNASSSQHLPQRVTFSGPITDLNRLPSAQHLQHLHPQTVTLNLVAALISRSETRTVSLRRNRSLEMDLIKLLIGDETRAGFEISFWLPPSPSSNNPPPNPAAAATTAETSAQRKILESLRSGDVLLLTNVALSEYRGGVYGQSLNMRTMRNRTSVIAVKGLEEEMVGVLAGKVGKVRGWAERFVGGTTKARGEKRGLEGGDDEEERRGGRKRLSEILPPDDSQ